MRNRFHTRLAALLCAAVLLVTSCPVSRAAETVTPMVTVSAATAEQGGSCTVTVTGRDFSAMTALGLMIAYDSNALTVTGASAASLGLTSVNKNTPGFIQYSLVSTSDTGLSGSMTLLTVTFRVDAAADAREYPVSVFITEAAALVGGEDTAVTVSGQAGSVTVREPAAVTPTVYFYSRLSSTSVESGDTVSMTVYTGSARGLAAGQFGFEYDSDLFEFVSLEPLSAMKQGNYSHTVNSANAGVAVMGYVTADAVTSGDLMQLTLRAKEGVSGTAEIVFAPNSLFDGEENPLQFSNSATKSVTVTKKAEEEILPRVWISIPEELTTNRSFTAEFWVEGRSGLAAADFAVGYDPAKLTCLTVTTPFASGEDGGESAGGFVEISDSREDGTIRFSYLSGTGLTADTVLIRAEFQAAENAETDFTLMPAAVTGSDPVDGNVKPVVLEYVPASGRILVPLFAVVFRDWDGAVLSEQTVPYLSAAAAPVDPRRDYTETLHYIFSGWDTSFASVSEDLTVTAVYAEAAHTLGNWTETDEEIHTKACVCGYTETADHGWSGWAGDESGHSRSCTDCGAEQSGEHEFGEWAEVVGWDDHHHVCSICTYGESAPHNWGTWTDAGNGQHKSICADCGAEKTAAHTMGAWGKVGETQHTRGCTDCTYTETADHSWSGWTDAGDGTHSRSCTDCKEVQTQEHTFLNGCCTACGEDGAAVTVTDGVATISVPGLAPGGKILTAIYDADRRLIVCYVADGTDTLPIYDISGLTGVAAIRVFVTDGGWMPLRAPIPWSDEVMS